MSHNPNIMGPIIPKSRWRFVYDTMLPSAWCRVARPNSLPVTVLVLFTCNLILVPVINQSSPQTRYLWMGYNAKCKNHLASL